MGKFNAKKGKKKAVGLEIVPKEADVEVKLPESRRSDDKPLKKVKIKKILKRTLFSSL